LVESVGMGWNSPRYHHNGQTKLENWFTILLHCSSIGGNMRCVINQKHCLLPQARRNPVYPFALSVRPVLL